MAYYMGITKYGMQGAEPHIQYFKVFKSREVPMKYKYGDKYKYVIGPFRSVESLMLKLDKMRSGSVVTFIPDVGRARGSEYSEYGE